MVSGSLYGSGDTVVLIFLGVGGEVGLIIHTLRYKRTSLEKIGYRFKKRIQTVKK